MHSGWTTRMRLRRARNNARMKHYVTKILKMLNRRLWNSVGLLTHAVRSAFPWADPDFIYHQVALFCDSVLFFSRPRSEGWPHHGHTFSIYLCPLSISLTLQRGVLSMSWCCLSILGRAWSSSPACTWHCSLHYLFLQTTPFFPYGVTI